MLISYFQWQDVELVKELANAGVSVLVDSGAFGAFKAGKVLDVIAYAEFLQEVAPFIDASFNMDVIGDTVKSKRNLEVIKSYGVNPLPVWQGFTAEEFKGVDAFIEGEPYVAIGGLVKTSNTERTAGFNEKRIASFMKAVAGRSNVHLLGYAKHMHVKSFKPYSCDASTVANPLRFGSDFVLWDIDNGRRTLLNSKEKIKDMAMMDLVLKITRNPDFKLNEVMRRNKREGELWCPARELALASYANLASYIEKVAGTKMYIVGCLIDEMHIAKALASRGL